MPQHVRGDHLRPVRQVHLGARQRPRVGQRLVSKVVVRALPAPRPGSGGGSRRSSPVRRNRLRIFERAQTTCRLPPCVSVRLAAATSVSSPVASMKVTWSRSITRWWLDAMRRSTGRR
jgi:hypothetical protein